MGMKNTLEQMIQDVSQGQTVDQCVKKLETGVEVNALRGWVKSVLEEAERQGKIFTAVKSKQILFQTLEEQHSNSADMLFHKLSDMKYLVNIRNLQLSQELLAAQGMDPAFLKASFLQAHEEEQQMEDVTEEELQAMRDELSGCLPDEDESIFTLLQQGAETSEGAELLAKAEEAAQKATPQNREDFAVLMAAAYLKEHPEASPQEAAKAAAVHTSRLTNQVFPWLLDGVESSLAIMAGGVVLDILGELAEVSLFSSMAEVLVTGGAISLSLLSVLTVGVAAAVGIQKLTPHVKKLWIKCKPQLAKLVNRVKVTALKLFGVVRDQAFRPAIYWVANTAFPSIREHVTYPLKRRLVRFMDWLREKRDQVAAFFRSAAVQKEEAEEDGEFFYYCQPASEGEEEFAYT